MVKNIIITNVGRRGYLVVFFKSIPEMKGKVFVSDCDITASGLYGNNDGFFILPKPVDNELDYVNALIDVCEKNEINVVVPVIDPEIYILSGYKDLFEEKRIQVVVSDRRVLDICFDKLKMNTFLKSIGMPYPMTFSSLREFYSALGNNLISFPVVLKPILGSGSVETYIVDTEAKMNSLFHQGLIIQEKIDGVEYGVDLFNSLNGEPLRCVIKRKISMRSGETDKCISVHDSIIQNDLLLIAKRLRHIGNLDCDVIVSNGATIVIDMNPRFGGGYPATHSIGVNLIDVLFQLLNGKDVRAAFGNYPEDVLVMKEIAVKKTIIHGILL